MPDITRGRRAEPALVFQIGDLAELHRELGIPPDYAASRGLTYQAEPDGILVTIAVREGREIQLTASAASAWQKMMSAAARDRISLVPLSGFRSVQRQAEIIRAKRTAGQAIPDILKVNAAPGFSEHHTGRALDVGAPGGPPFEEVFAQTPAFQWLIANAAAFGFSLSYPKNNPHGFSYEPWHWLCRQAEPT
jgi:D-alanyl-D-alanine carboxypeptidase